MPVDLTIYHYIMQLGPYDSFDLKSSLSYIATVTFLLTFSRNIFFHLFAFNQCASLNPNWVYFLIHTQHILWSCFVFTYLAILCFLNKESNPFTSEVIIYRERFSVAIFQLFFVNLIVPFCIFLSCSLALLILYDDMFWSFSIKKN